MKNNALQRIDKIGYIKIVMTRDEKNLRIARIDKERANGLRSSDETRFG